MRAPPHHLRRVCLAWAFLLLCVLQLAASLHALTPHELCPEHGEAIHASAGPAHLEAPSDDPSIQDAGARPQDHHCPLLAFLTSAVGILAANHGDVLADAPRTGPRVLGGAAVEHVLDCLDVAPKCSPPLRA